MARVRDAATRDITPALLELARMEVQTERALAALEEAHQHVAGLLSRQLPDAQALRGESDLDESEIRRRREAAAARELQRARDERERRDAVLADLLSRQAALRAMADARIRLAQSTGLLCHQSVLARVAYYAEHLIRRHGHGSTLLQASWPQLVGPARWLIDGAEAERLLSGALDEWGPTDATR